MNNYYQYDLYRSIPNTNHLYNPKEGYLRGNLFKNLYSPYKNYEVKRFNPRSDKERCFIELSELSFAMHELNLYLDLHPEDQSMFMLFKDYREKLAMMMNEYENKYGPININTNTMNNSFTWVNSSWPWEEYNV